MIEVQTPSGIARPLQIKVRDSGGVAQPVQIVQVRNALGETKTVWAAMSASAAPASAYGFASSPVARGIATNSVTITVLGGVGTISYSWAGTAGWSSTAPSSATTNFISPMVGPSESESGAFTCTVTDSIGQSTTVDVDLNASNSYYSGGVLP